MKLKVGIVLLVAALGLGVEAKHYSFVGGYPANGVSEARAASMECNSGVNADVKVTKVTTIKRGTKMGTKCRHCGSSSYGVGCPHSPSGRHEK